MVEVSTSPSVLVIRTVAAFGRPRSPWLWGNSVIFWGVLAFAFWPIYWPYGSIVAGAFGIVLAEAAVAGCARLSPFGECAVDVDGGVVDVGGGVRIKVGEVVDVDFRHMRWRRLYVVGVSTSTRRYEVAGFRARFNARRVGEWVAAYVGQEWREPST